MGRSSLVLVFADQQTGLVSPSQPHDARDVDDAHPQAVEHSVFRGAARARAMAHRHGDDAGALALEQRGQEAMHVVEPRQVHEHFAREQLDAATGIRRTVAEQLLRTPLAMLDCSLRNAVSLRLALRLPMKSCTPRPSDESRAAMSLGMSAGSFCPSPSSVATQGARAARTPLTTAALWPLRNE